MDKLTIKQWRLVRGHSQQKFAEIIGVSVTTYRSKENGKTDWKIEEIKTICKFLDISIENQLSF